MILTKRQLLVILGPTSTGKTDLTLDLAKKFNGELISCDSRQVYVGLDIGTGKYPAKFQISNFKFQIDKADGYWEVNGVKIWMYDVIDPKKQYSVADYVRDASKVIDEIQKRKKLPIVVGGTGLYLKALIQGLSNLVIPIDKKLRKELGKLSLNKLQEKLQKLSSDRWQSLNESDKQNSRRLIRQIEISFTSEESLRATVRGGLSFKYDILKIGLIAPREILYKRADGRVLTRIKQGMINEVERLHNRGLTLKRMRQLGLEYGVLANYLEGKIKDVDELIKILQGRIHSFLRRQLTWFKKEKNISWFDITEKNFSLNVEKAITKWYYQSDDT